MTILVRPAELEDIAPIAEKMREQDRQEVKASSGEDPMQSLSDSLLVSDLVWTAEDESGPIAMFGVARIPGGLSTCGAAWLLGTDRLVDVDKRTWWVLSRKYVKRMEERYDILMNYVDDRNTVSQRWLSRLGFRKIHTIPEYGWAKIPFSLWVKGDFDV